MKFDLKPETIKYIKILYKDGGDFSHCVKASVKTINEHIIYACIKKECWEKIPVPQDVLVNFVCNDGLYKSKSNLRYTKYEEPYLYMCLQLPQETELQQNREFFRVHIDQNVVISFRTDDDVIRISSRIYDISANGLRVKLDKQTTFPEEVFLDIYFENREIRTMAKYIRSDEEDNIIKASFSFTDLADNDRDYISQICIRKQIEDKRSSLE